MTKLYPQTQPAGAGDMRCQKFDAVLDELLNNSRKMKAFYHENRSSIDLELHKEKLAEMLRNIKSLEM